MCDAPLHRDRVELVNIVGKIPAPWSLGITTGLIVGGVLVSLWKTRGQVAAPLESPDSPSSGPAA